ncbi:hypothetical protein WJX73_003683 [Symbiochloris irregularis]|uniref:TMEM205-like domain-containing protein n=1 Tax=Symbiochloris irregularis TaxID=706552 RepID=A0AAW1P1K1_9CHLO
MLLALTSGSSRALTALRSPAVCHPTRSALLVTPCAHKTARLSPEISRVSLVTRASAAGSAAVPSQSHSSSTANMNGNGLSPLGAKPSQSNQANEEVQGAMLEPSAANKNWVRVSAIVAAIAAVSGSMNFLPGQLSRSVHLTGFAVWLGTNVWVSVAGLIMFKNLPRQTFGKLQAKLFPPYFAANVAAIAVQIGSLAFTSGTTPVVNQIALGGALVINLANWLVVEPGATRVMLERYQLENSPNRDAAKVKQLYKQFGKLHGLSSSLNLGSLVGAFVHGWWLSSLFTFAV